MALVGKRRPDRTLAAVFDPRDNCLNLIRLILAAFVIVWHSFPLTGTVLPIEPLRQFVGHISVDSFFAISGFLILSSWVNRPRVVAFLRARVLRIFPAFWAALVVTAVLIAPVALVVGGEGLPAGYWLAAAGYVGVNSLLWINDYSIAGTPASVPYPAVWNGSMWTLFWEFLCYLGVLAVGVTGLLRRRWTIAVLFVAAEVAVIATSYGPIDNAYVANAAHFGIFFMAGTVVYRYRDRLPVSPLLLAGSVVVLVASLFLPDYRVVSALPVAYLVMCLGALIKGVNLRTDLSYGTYVYGFPVQQFLVSVVGAGTLGVAGLAAAGLAITLPLAAASWFLVERPALRLKGIRRRPRTVQQEAVAESAPDGHPVSS